MFIASDANAEGLLETAWKAARKQARGGIPNLLCIAEPFDVLARELGSIADHLTVILPWGSLLRAVAVPEPDSLLQIANLCAPSAKIEIVLSFDPERDGQEGARLGLSHLNHTHITSTLPKLYEQAGLRILSADKFPQQELAKYATTWAMRLATGRSRDTWKIRAQNELL